MEIRKITVLVLLLTAGAVSAQNNDPRRSELYSLYDIRSRNAINAQSAAISTMSFHHQWMQSKEKDIANLQKEFNKYLENLHDVLTIAAEIYGNIHEFMEMASNLKSLTEACQDSPTNIFANAFKEDKRQIITNIVGTTTELMMDIKKSIVDNTRMTEKERIQLLDDVRRKLKSINRQLRRVERNIRYYNLCDLWNDIRGEKYDFRKRTNAEIASEARDEWQNHYRPILMTY